MDRDHSIDIVIPSFRLDEDVLLRIINLKRPEKFQVSIYIVSDNPNIIIPGSIQALHQSGKIILLINETNLGFSATRNKGIQSGSGKWILLLDDDIHPSGSLLLAYADAIQKCKDALGFVGVTNFPKPNNNVTRALKLSGIVSHFENESLHEQVRWAPTANLILNRDKLVPGLFDESLRAGGEDIDLLVRNSLHFREQYITVSSATVEHPWWDNGTMQTKRLFRYGIAASQIAAKEPVKHYTYRDFTNTSETILLLLLVCPVALFFHFQHVVFSIGLAVIVAEIITNYLKAMLTSKNLSPLLALYLAWVKNCREAGFLYGSLSRGYLNGFALRIDMGFSKPHPAPFRLNRWKIIKMVLLVVSILLLVTI